MKCGARIADDSKFCTKCGAPVEGSLGEATPSGGSEGDVANDGDRTERLSSQDEAGGEPAVAMPPASEPAAAAAVAMPPAGDGSRAHPSSSPDMTAPLPTVSDAPSSRGHRAPVIAACIAVVLIALVTAGIVLWSTLGRPASDAADTPVEQDAGDVSEAAATLSLTSVDTSAFPQIDIDVTITADDGSACAGLAGDDVTFKEGPYGSETDPVVESFSDQGDGSYHVELTSTAAESDSSTVRRLTLAMTKASGMSGNALWTFSLPDDASDAARQPVAPPPAPDPSTTDYLLPASSSRLIGATELNGFTDWELCLARNEIYARHGREFNNERIQAYFNDKSWYTPRYTPSSFDENVTLSDIELKNIDTIVTVERARGSSYVS